MLSSVLDPAGSSQCSIGDLQPHLCKRFADLQNLAVNLAASNIELLQRTSPDSMPDNIKQKLAQLEKLADFLVSSNEELRARNAKLVSELQKQAAANSKLRMDRDVLRSQAFRIKEKYKKLGDRLGSRVQPDQLNALTLNSTRGMKWSKKTLLIGYKLHFACGTVGYETVSALQLPLPSPRTLQQHLQNLKISTGPFYQVFDFMRSKIPFLKYEFILGLDEMSLMPKTEFDPNLRRMIGKCTLPIQAPVTKEMRQKCGNDDALIQEARKKIQEESFQSKAEKGMILALGSLLGARCKQIVGCHLTGKSVSGSHLKEELWKIITLSHDVGLFVRALVCDMGNGALFKELGIEGGPGKLVNSLQHPVVPTEKLFVTPDVVHVFKNTVAMFGQHRKVHLSQDIVEAFNLPTSEADFHHILFLRDYQKDMQWRLAPKLNSSDILGGHFRKMKVNNAVNIFNHRTAAALKFLAHILNHPDLLTTAFFIELVYTWFKFMTSRTPALALGKRNEEAYAGARETLSTMMHMFENLRFRTKDGGWKPCQTGVKLCTKTVIDLAVLYVEVQKVVMFFTGNLTQDFIENINSLVRIMRPFPTPRQFKDRVRRLLVSQFMKKIPGSSYDYDGAEDLLTLLEDNGLNKAQPDGSSPPPQTPQQEQRGQKLLTEKEMPVFYYVCGYVVFKLLEEKSELRGCLGCIQFLKATSPHKYSLFTRFTNYTENNVVEVSDAAFNLLVTAENTIAVEKCRFDLENNEEFSRFVDKVTESSKRSDLRNCHSVQSKLLHRFMLMRNRLGFDGFFQSEEQVPGSHFSSKTMGSKCLADLKK